MNEKIPIKIIIPPSTRELFCLEKWAVKNNVFLHPALIDAVVKKIRLYVLMSVISGAVITVAIAGVLQYIFGR
jgi:hypothetical protein